MKVLLKVNADLRNGKLLAAMMPLVLLATVFARHTGLFECWKVFGIPLAAVIGLLAVSPPLSVAAYEILRDDEFEPYRGAALYLRSGACGLAYVALWGVFSLLASRGVITGELWNWAFIVPPFIVIGGLAGMGAFDLEFGNGLFHYSFYIVATLLLRWVAGMKWIWDVS